MRPPLHAVIADAEALGTAVRWVPLPEGRRGAWHAESGTIWLAEGMGESAAVAALLHEVEHARRGDECPQPGWVERRIDRTVACRIAGISRPTLDAWIAS